MIGLIRADLLKLRKRWLYPVLVLIMGFFLGLGAVFLLVIPSIDPNAIPGMPVLGRSDALLLGAQQAVGQTWFALILAVVFLGGEVTTPIWATELTAEARRPLHLLSKLIVLSVAAWIGIMLAIAGWSVIAVITTEGQGLAMSEWIGIAWKAALTQITWTALGLGAVSVIRSTGISIGAALAFSFFEGIGAIWEPYRAISLTSASTALFGNLGTEISGGFGVSFLTPMSLAHALTVIGGWTVLGVAIGWVGLQLKDP